MIKYTGKGVYGAVAIGKVSVFKRQTASVEKVRITDPEAEKVRVTAERHVEESKKDIDNFVNADPDKKLTGNFASNKGRLPMPITGPYQVVRGFGSNVCLHRHPIQEVAVWCGLHHGFDARHPHRVRYVLLVLQRAAFHYGS